MTTTITTGMPINAVMVLIGKASVLASRSQISSRAAPVSIEAGIRMRWSAEAKNMRAEVRNGQPDEAHRTAEGRDGSCEQDRREEDQRARALDVESHRAGVVLAQQQEVQGFDDGDRRKSRPDGRKHQQQAVARDVAQRPHGQTTNDFRAASFERYCRISTTELTPELNIMPRIRITMMSLMRRLTAMTTASTSADPIHAAPAMPSDWMNNVRTTPSSGAPSRKSATPSEAPN